MIKIKEMVAGLLLKFNELDNYDLGLLMYELNKKYEIDIEDFDIGSLKNYINITNNIVNLNEKLTFNTIINNHGIKLKRKFEVTQGRYVKNYLDNISIEEFVLRKINYLTNVKADNTSEFLSKNQITILKELGLHGYITTVWNDDVDKDNYQVIELTQKGKLLLFILDNEKEIKRFQKDLINLNYDYTLVNNYLMSENLDEDIEKILNAEKFYNYCLGFNIYPYMPKYKERRLYSN